MSCRAGVPRRRIGIRCSMLSRRSPDASGFGVPRFAVPALLLFLAVVLALPLSALCAESPLPPDALLLARWIAQQQYTNPHQPSYGAIRTEAGPAVRTPDGAEYCAVSPYFANLAMLSLLRAKTPGCMDVANRWIDWYFAHLTAQSAPDGVPYSHFYHPDGTGETACAKPGDHELCNYNDATDSAATTFFSVLWAAHKAAAPGAFQISAERKHLIEGLAALVMKLQQSDGLCWAKVDWRVKYTEDNSEVFAGLCDLANLEREVFHDSQQAALHQKAAERVRNGILKELYDPRAKLFRVGKFENRTLPALDLDKWYPDTQEQFWPILFGVISPTDARARAILAAVNIHWNGRTRPDWATDPNRINDGWIESGSIYGALLVGDTERVQSYVDAVKKSKFPKVENALQFRAPFNIGDAGWLLQILTSDAPGHKSE